MAVQAWHEKTTAIHLRTLHACSTKELFDQELSHITQVFMDNGFPLPTIQHIISMKSHGKEARGLENLEEIHNN